MLAQRGAYLLLPDPYDGTVNAPALTGDAWSVLCWPFTESYAAAPAIPTAAKVRSAAEAAAAQGHTPTVR